MPAQSNALGTASHHRQKPRRGGPFGSPASVIDRTSSPRLDRPFRAGGFFAGLFTWGVAPGCAWVAPLGLGFGGRIACRAYERMVADRISVFSANGANQCQPRATPWVPRRIIKSPEGAGHSRRPCHDHSRVIATVGSPLEGWGIFRGVVHLGRCPRLCMGRPGGAFRERLEPISRRISGPRFRSSRGNETQTSLPPQAFDLIRVS